jgi:uncharacterized OsmC-like protein
VASQNVREVVVEGPASGFRQDVHIGPFHLVGDEPADQGGQDQGPSPYDYLLAALGTCTSMTIAMVARRRGWPLESVRVRLRHGRVHAEDCADCETKKGMIDRIERDVELVGALSEEQRASLLDIAGKCPVARTLTSEVRIESRLIPAAASPANPPPEGSKPAT